MTLEEKMKQASALKMQCKRHQIFREKPLEAVKMAEAGQLHIEIATSLKGVDDDAHLFHYTQAAACLARAKRLCRDILRNKE